MCDWEMMLRVLAEHDIVCIPVPTREQDLRDDGTQLETSQAADKHVEFRRRLYEAHPAADRPSVVQRRAQILANIAAQGVPPPLPPTHLTQPHDAGYGPADLRAPQ